MLVRDIIFLSVGDAEERKWAAKAAEREAERKHKLEMEKLVLENERLNEQRSVSSEDQQAALSQASQNVVARTKVPVLPGFVDGKDNLDSYLLRFERYDTDAGWERSDWATRLSPSLSGRALDVYSGLSDEQARIMISYRRLFYRGMTSRNRVSVEDSEELSRRDRNLLVSSL